MYVIITAIIIVIMTQWIVMLGGGFYTRKNKFWEFIKKICILS